jgi:membrane associated rhomboid family serine protease
MPRGDDFGQTPQLAMPRLTPAVKWMLIVLGAAFLILLFDDKWGFPTSGRIAGWGALFPSLVLKKVQLWRLATYPIVNTMDGDISPLMWGGLTLYFFGTDLEEQLGTRRFLVFVALCVLLAGVVATLYGLVHPVYYTQPVMGLAPLSLALTAAWGTRFPNRRLFFPPVSGKWLVIGLLAIQIIYIIARATRESPAASIGAIAIGFLLTRYWDRIDDVLDRMRIRRARAKRDRVLRAIRGGLDDRPASGQKSGKKPIDKRFLN